MKLSFDSLKSYLPSLSMPSLYTSSKKSITSMVTSLTMSESEYLYKTETTEKEIVSLLMSKMDMEIILGLKLIISNIQSDKDIVIFLPRIVEIFTMTKDYYIKLLCVNIIDNLTLTKRSELLLLINIIRKNSHDPDSLNRILLLHLLASLRSQDETITNDCYKMLLQFTNDSNPLLRRIALVVIVAYLKERNSCDNDGDGKEITSVMLRYISDPHPLVSSTFFYAISELGYKDYVGLMLHKYYDVIIETMIKYDEYYYERAVFTMINFAKVILVHNMKENKVEIMKMYNTFYWVMKHSTVVTKVVNSLYGILEIINALGVDHDYKQGKQLKKISRILISLTFNKEVSASPMLELCIFDLIKAYLIPQTNIHMIIRKEITTHINLFLITTYKDTINDYIPMIKLEILTLLTNDLNIKWILNEIINHLLSYPINSFLKTQCIKTIELICNKHSQDQAIISLCIERLIELLKIKDETVINQVIMTLSRLISKVNEQKRYVLIYSIKNFKKSISSTVAKANIIRMITEEIETIPTVVVDFYRRLLGDIEEMSDAMKMMMIGLSLRIWDKIEMIISKYKDNDDKQKEEIKNKVEMMVKYFIEKMMYDKEYTIREKARIVDGFIKAKVKMVTLTSDTNIKNEKKTMIDRRYLLSCGKEKFTYDITDECLSDKMKSISLQALIKATCPTEVPSVGHKELDNSNTKEKYTSCSNTNTIDTNIGNEISNFNSGMNIEEKRKELKNQLDEFLNGDDEDDEDEIVVSIKSDNK